MCRTIRRIKEKKHNKSGKSHFSKSYTTTYIEIWHGSKSDVVSWGGLPCISLEKEQYNKAFHDFHSDTKKNYGWSNPQYSKKLSHITSRMHYKQEISKFFKNNHYEVLEKKLRCLSWDR